MNHKYPFEKFDDFDPNQQLVNLYFDAMAIDQYDVALEALNLIMDLKEQKKADEGRKGIPLKNSAGEVLGYVEDIEIGMNAITEDQLDILRRINRSFVEADDDGE